MAEPKVHAERHLKDEDELEPVQIVLDKNTVLQECRILNDPAFVSRHPKRCCMQLTRVLYLLAQGETLTPREAEDIFFGSTKLFQSPDGNLRRLLYLFLKEVSRFVDPGNVVMVFASLAKDMTDSEVLNKANAIRVMGRMADGSTGAILDRPLPPAIVSDSRFVSQSALTASYALLRSPGGADVVRRWVGEIQTASSSRDPMVQYHALTVLHGVKRRDSLAMSRLLSNLRRGGSHSDMALVMLLRYTAALMRSDMGAMDPREGYSFLESHLTHRSEMVMYEAARAIAGLPNASAVDMHPAVSALFELLGHGRPATRFGAVRTLSQIAETYPDLVSTCNTELEALIRDPNRTIATYAITTLLRTGEERHVDRFLKRIGAFLADLGDEFKIVVVRAVHSLALRLPRKLPALMTFLSHGLREEGGKDFKRAIVESIIDLAERRADARVEALFHLCEFIEDCEFTALSVRVLHYLGDAGPSTRSPGSFIRFIYNRVILERAPVRAAAVSALVKFAARVPSLRASVAVLLDRSRGDEDDEVRDRATVGLRLLQTQGKLAQDAPEAADVSHALAAVGTGSLPMPARSLRRALELYQLRPARGAFSFDALPLTEDASAGGGGGGGGGSGGAPGSGGSSVSNGGPVTYARMALAAAKRARPAADTPASADAPAAAGGGAVGGAAGAAATGPDPLEALFALPELADLGPLDHSVAPEPLTEKELEYVVTLSRHVFRAHMVLQFEVRNTVPAQVLADVVPSVDLPRGCPYEVMATVPARVVREGGAASCFVCLRLREPPAAEGGAEGWAGARVAACAVPSELTFRVVEAEGGEVDEDDLDGGEEEEYPLEEFSLSVRHLVKATGTSGFRASWEAAGAATESISRGVKPFRTVAAAISATVRAVGLAPCEGTGEVGSAAEKHQTLLAGTMPDGSLVLGRIQVSLAPTRDRVMMRFGFRSPSADLSKAFVDLVP